MGLSFYQHFQRAYDYYNKTLFDNELADCLIVFQRKSRTFGYISYDRHSIVGQNTYMHELALNPDYFAYRTVIETLSTLVHEMCHLKQHIDGTETRKTYHNKEFSALMKERGLQTSHTGLEGGKEVGQNMTHYIMHDGRFLEVTLDFLRETDFKTFYDRFTPNYIEPYQFYERSINFISLMKGKVRVEDIIPPYLLEHIQKNPQILSGGDAEPELQVTANPDGDDLEPDDVEEPVEEPNEPVVPVEEPAEPDEPKPVEEPAEPEPTDDDQDEDEDDQEDRGDLQVTPTLVEAIAQDIKTNVLVEKQKKVEPSATVNIHEIIGKLKSPEQLLDPIQNLMNERRSNIHVTKTVAAVKKVANSKCKFTCHGCDSNLWGKESLNVICADCDQPYELVG